MSNAKMRERIALIRQILEMENPKVAAIQIDLRGVGPGDMDDT
jgi:hypothetical protein